MADSEQDQRTQEDQDERETRADARVRAMTAADRNQARVSQRGRANRNGPVRA